MSNVGSGVSWLTGVTYHMMLAALAMELRR